MVQRLLLALNTSQVSTQNGIGNDLEADYTLEPPSMIHAKQSVPSCYGMARAALCTSLTPCRKLLRATYRQCQGPFDACWRRNLPNPEARHPIGGS